MGHPSQEPTDGSGAAALEACRLEALDRLDILDTPREETFDRIARLVRNVFDLPVGVVSMIDGHRQWIKAAEGYANSEVERQHAFCNLTIQSVQPLVISDALQDTRFHDSRHVAGPPHIRCYVGVPLTTHDGYNIGTLCAFGHEPRQFSAREVEILTDLARVAMDELELRQLSVTDNLTGLLTRGAFREQTERAIALAARHKHALSLVAFDLDHFKAINDTYGHGVGDRVLRGVAQACREGQRQTDLIGRLGGEEFATVLPHTDKAGALETAERMRHAIERLRFDAGGRQVGVTASFGIASLNAEATDMDTLLTHADAALYEAKAAGRNRCTVWRSARPAAPAPRRRVLKAGRIVFNNRASTMDCTVRSLGEDGAGIDVGHTSGIPPKFRLVIRSDDFETECRVVAQTDKHLEVEFI